jgi:hypothetical protein
LIDTLWTDFESGESFEELIIPLISAPAGGFKDLPPFAIAVFSVDEVHVAARGPVSVSIDTGQEVRVRGEKVTTWREESFAEPKQVRLSVDGASAGMEFPLRSGVVTTSAIVFTVGASGHSPVSVKPPKPRRKTEPKTPRPKRTPAEPVQKAAEPAEVVVPPAPVVERPVEIVPIAAEAKPAEVVELVVVEPVTPPIAEPAVAETIIPAAAEPDSIAEAVIAAEEPAPSDTPVSVETRFFADFNEDGIPDDQQSADQRPDDQQSALQPNPPAAAESAAGPPPAEPDSGFYMTDYAFMWDDPTVMSAAEVAAVRPDAEMVEGVPNFAEAASTDGSDEDWDDHDGMTVMKPVFSGLPPVSARPVAPAPAPSNAPMVHGRLCSRCSFSNSTQKVNCSKCGMPLQGDTKMIPRPSLGTVKLSTGEQFELDQPMIFGRRPKATRFSGADVPRIVTLGGDLSDISRSHLRIMLQDWNVLVSDAGSTNGTMLRRPGQPDRRLQTSDEVMAKQGDVFDLGNGITVTVVRLL